MDRQTADQGVDIDNTSAGGNASLLVLLEVLTSFSRTLLRDFDVGDILGDLVGRMPEILPVDGAGVMMEDEDGVLRFTAASDTTIRHIESLQIELGEGPCLAAYMTGEQVLLDDVSAGSRFPAFAPRALESGLHAVYSFPMWHDGEALGALDLYRGSPATLTSTEAAAGQTLADVATVYVVHGREREHARLEAEQVYQRAITDPLTGLANRRLFIDHLDSALARSTRNGGTVAVFYLDLDNFKPVNDRLGHAAGDQVLIEVASRLRHAVRPGDTPARVGGDEFAVVCDELAAPDEAIAVAERILAAMHEPIPTADSPVVVTSSIGVATGSGGNVDAASLLASADAALYVAKANGRNRIESSAS